YAVRDVIGSLDVIQNFKPETIRDFYHKWYRTDLEAIAVVGDIDVAAMEARIKEMFSSIPAVENPAQKPEYFEVPEHEETYYVLATDPEISATNISIRTFARDTVPSDYKKTAGYMRASLLEGLYNSMVSNRIKEIMQRNDAPFLGASFGVSGFAPGYTGFSISTRPRPNEEARALAAVMTEYERVRRYGFSDDELKPIIANTLAGLENSYKRKDKISNESHIGDVKSHFLQDANIISFDTYYELMNEILPSITASEVSALAPRLDSTRNRVFTITGPATGEEFLTEARMHEIIDSVRNADIKPYDYQTVDTDLLDQVPAGGRIVKTRRLPRFDATEWSLSNGAKVIFRKADYEKDIVSLVGFSWGGTSLYDVGMLPAAGTAASMVQAFGAGDHKPLDLQKVLTGNTASADAGIGSLSETVSGSCAPKDLETMFQLVYMKFEHPRYDEELFNTIMERQRISYERGKNLPQKQMSDSLTRILADYHPRALTLDSAYLDAITLDRVKEVYEDRIKDASDFTFFIVGDVDADSIRPYVETYLGSLKSINRKETWRDNKVRMPKGKTEKTIALELSTPKSTVLTVMRNTKMKYSRRNNILMDILEGVLQLRYTENIREKEGGTYGVSVSGSSDRRPYTCYSLSMQFECDPDRVADLKPLLYAEIEKLANEAPTREEFDKVVKNMIKNHEQSKPHNSYWMNALQSYYINGEDITDSRYFDDIVNKLT
ncbi:MAG: insulinase family protein, partial [Muribaculaceae bacterium]|nr:insulinase family protein [Muribaculaceae bacterium]